MREYVDYFIGIELVRNFYDSLQSGTHSGPKPAEYKAILLRRYGAFSLPDLLTIPFKHILSYHLLLNNLLKLTAPNHVAAQFIKETRLKFEEVGNYLNKCKGDDENRKLIEKLVEDYVFYNNDYKYGKPKGPILNNLDLFQFGHYYNIKSI